MSTKKIVDGTKEYRCTICGFSHNNERTVRTHIESADNAGHKDRSGFQIGAPIEGIDSTGDSTDEVSNRDVPLHTDNIQEVKPEDVEGDKSIKVIAAKAARPDYSVAELVTALSSGEDDEESVDVSKTHARRTVNNYFGLNSTSYERLTERQQKGVDALVEYRLGEYETQTAAAEDYELGVSVTSQMKSKFSEIIERRVRERREKKKSPNKGQSEVSNESEGGAQSSSETGGFESESNSQSDGPVVSTDGEDSYASPDGKTTREESREDSNVVRDTSGDPVLAQVRLLRRLVVDSTVEPETALKEIERVVAAEE